VGGARRGFLHTLVGRGVRKKIEPRRFWSPRNNFPSRGGKYSFFEGGIKVVGMLTWPRVLASQPGRAGNVSGMG
jgi:hypothetical protein